MTGQYFINAFFSLKVCFLVSILCVALIKDVFVNKNAFKLVCSPEMQPVSKTYAK